jgi:hypothetical protein
MKTSLKVLLAVSVLSAVAAPAIAQSSAATSETTAVTIVTPITIAPVTQMSFGSVVMTSPTVGGTIVLTALGAPTYTGATALAGAAAPTAAKFHVTGVTGQAFTLALASVDLSDGASHTIPISGLTSAGPTTLTGGAVDITVGGTLTLAIAQTPGVYHGSVTATVNYN